MIRAFVLALLIATAPAHATLGDRAGNAALADSATTLGALALGAAEANPIGLATIPAKIGILWHCKALPEDERAECLSVADALWGGAAVNNVCIIAALLTAGAFAPVCVAAGVGYGIWSWNKSAPEREFAYKCEEAKRAWGMTEKCVFKAAEG